MFGIGPMELVVIVVVALLIFGPQKLPEFARTLGKGLAEFRRASNDLRQSLALDELQNDLRKTMNDATRTPVPRPAQAGDSLPPGSGPSAAGGNTTRDASDGAPGNTPSDAASGPAAGADSTASLPPWKGQPGELPEGIDHEHHDPIEEQVAATDPRRAGDPELGNVPVSAVDPADPRRG